MLHSRRRSGEKTQNQNKGRKRHLSASHAQQYRRGAAAYADRVPREQSAARRQRLDPRGPASLHGRQGSPHSQSEISRSACSKI